MWEQISTEALTAYYEESGLFAKIIDVPAEEALRKGFEIESNDILANELFYDLYEQLNIDEILITAIKRTRLFGGCIVVMLINDGGGIEEPLNFKRINSIDGMKIYDCSLITFDENTKEPELFSVNSKYGRFQVHKSRCLIFKNGTIPERSGNKYRFWGVPEYIRISNAVKNVETSHNLIPKLLFNSVQAVYKTKGLKELIATEIGENILFQRLQIIDAARSMMNSIVIDAENEDYTFKQIQFSGIADVIRKSFQELSAVTSIPQRYLTSKYATDKKNTDNTSTENWYNFIERIQQRMLKHNLIYLNKIIIQMGINKNQIYSVSSVNIKFIPLWSQTQLEKAEADLLKAKNQLTKAKTIETYIQIGAITPEEAKKSIIE